MKITLRPSLLLLAAALVASAPLAHAAPKSLTKFKANATGNYAASATSAFFTQTSTGPATGKLTVTGGGTAGKLVLSGNDPALPGSAYTATLTFKNDGTVTTETVLPAVTQLPGSGRWKVAGSKITYTVTGNNAFGSYQAKGTIKGGGKKLKVAIAFTANPLSPGLPSQGQYTFTSK